MVACLLVVPAGRAAADDLADFQRARNAYDAGDYPLSVERFRELLGRDPSPSRAIREECLQFLGASLLFQGNEDQASAVFDQLLVLEPDWELDAAVFPTPILDVFARVKVQMRERLAALQAAEQQLAELERQRRLEEDRRRREALQAALEPRYLARVSDDRHLVLAFVPFGVGQFQNGQEDKGWTFLGLEAALGAANVWTFFSWDWYRREAHEWVGTTRGDQAAAYAEGYKIASWAVLGALLAAMVAGVIDALVLYEDPGTQWRMLSSDEVPDDRRLPVRDPAEFLPPPRGGPDETLPAAATLGWSFALDL
ncbi:MAG: hypothetical protein JXB32_04050 [Deltaproteobacteria bacterium]|nr:hypothetical protein [Deltaproteobacteria bacterium]